MTFTKITCAGAGTMGSQVAWQMAFHGKRVTVYDAIPAGLERGKAFHREYAELFARHRGATEQQIADSFERLTYTTDLSTAVSEADLISESVPESMAIKESFWRDASRHASTAHRVHHQHLHPHPEPAGALRRPPETVPGSPLRHRCVGFQHR